MSLRAAVAAVTAVAVATAAAAAAAVLIVPEQELPVEVGYVYGVHVYYIDVDKARKSQVLQDLAPKPSCPYAQHSAVLLQELSQLWTRLKAWTNKVSITCQKLVYVDPALAAVKESGIFHFCLAGVSVSAFSSKPKMICTTSSVS
jgi:hypothetical protein